MKTIRISLSEASIERAIRRLEEAAENLERGLDETVELLAIEGGEVAQESYGGMATAYGTVSDGIGEIVSTGEENLIAEFGAGDATLDPLSLFANAPKTDVFEGSYSLEVGSGEYWKSKMETGQGRWHFGGREYTEVQPRMGLFNAKHYVIDHSTETAKEVIAL